MNRSSAKNKICAIIPFFNEESFLRQVISETLKFTDIIIAVNDGSTDNSIEQVVVSEKVRILNLSENMGKGFAIKMGMIESLRLNTSLTVTIDADLQHDPSYIPVMTALAANFDIVIGDRLSDLKNMPFQRKLSNRLTSFLLSIKTGQKISDSQCGFRVYRTEILPFLTTEFDGFEAESEIIIKAARNGFKLGSTVIPTIYGDEKSKINPVTSITGFIKTLFI